MSLFLRPRHLLLLLACWAGLAPAAPPAASPAAAPLHERLAQAQAELQQLAAGPAPAGASAPELVEARGLLEQIIAQHTRQLGIAARQALAVQRRAEAESADRRWAGFDEPGPPYSILLAERLRTALQTASWQQQADLSKGRLLDGEMEGARQALAAAQAQLRLGNEQAEAAGGVAPPALRWALALAALRSRAASASADLVEAERGLLQVELAGHAARLSLLRRQLAVAERSPRFSPEDLRQVLGELEQQGEAAEQLLARRQALAAAARQAAEAAVPPAGSAQDALLVREQRRAEADNAELAVELARLQLEALRRKMVALRYRWALANAPDRRELPQARALLAAELQRLQAWSGYLGQQLKVTDNQAAEQERRLLAAAAPARPALRALIQLCRERAAMQADAQRMLDAQRGALQHWLEQLSAEQGGRGWRDWPGDAWQALRRQAGALWQYELATADDTVEVDGRKLTVKRSVTVGKSVGVLLLLALGYLASARLLGSAETLARRRLGWSAHGASLLRRWGQFALLALLFLVALVLVKIPLTVFAFLGGALALGTGLGAQSLLKNFMSGLTLLIERPLRIGDVVQVGELIGEVCNISIRSSTVRGFDGIETHVPNARLLEQSVTNWTYSSNHVRFAIGLRVASGAPLRQALALMEAAAAAHPAVLPAPPPRALLDDFGADGPQLALEYWLDLGGRAEARADPRLTASALRLAIAQAFADAAIAIPSAQRELYLRSAA